MLKYILYCKWWVWLAWLILRALFVRWSHREKKWSVHPFVFKQELIKQFVQLYKQNSLCWQKNCGDTMFYMCVFPSKHITCNNERIAAEKSHGIDANNTVSCIVIIEHGFVCCTLKPQRKANGMFTTLCLSKELVMQFVQLARQSSLGL